MMDESREKTIEEMKEELANHIYALVNYWEKQPRTTHEKLDGLAFSILAMLDGCTVLPSYKVSPIMVEGDKEYYIEHGENYYPEDVDIAGSLHDFYAQYSAQRDKEREEEDN